MTKRPLICASDGCGTVLGWARRAHDDKRPCPTCRRFTVFNIVDGQVEKRLALRAPKKVRKPKPRPKVRQEQPISFEGFDRMMRSNHYVDYQKC